jgi:hypothetical protein
LLSSLRERHKGYPYILIKLLENVLSVSLACTFTYVHFHRQCGARAPAINCARGGAPPMPLASSLGMQQEYCYEPKHRGEIEQSVYMREACSFIFHYFYLRFAGEFAYLSLLPPHCMCWCCGGLNYFYLIFAKNRESARTERRRKSE